LEILRFPWLRNPAHLDEPEDDRITRRKSGQVFPNEDPVGKTFIVNNDVSKPLRSGCYWIFPGTSHLQFDFLMTLKVSSSGPENNLLGGDEYPRIFAPEGRWSGTIGSKTGLRHREILASRWIADEFPMPKSLVTKLLWNSNRSRHSLASAGIQDRVSHVTSGLFVVWRRCVFILILLALILSTSTAKSATGQGSGLRKTVAPSAATSLINFWPSPHFSFLSFALGILLAWLLLPYFNAIVQSLIFPWKEGWLFPILGFAMAF